VNARSRDWRLVTSSLPLRFGLDAVTWLALLYPVLIAIGYLFKPSLTDPALVWPADAAALLAYLLLRYRYWPVVMLVTTAWELLSVHFINLLTGAPGTWPVTVAGLAGANIVSVVIPALLARLLRLINTDRQLRPIPSPLWVVVIMIGIVPGAYLGTWVHATAVGGSVTAIAVAIWTLSAALGMVTFVPALAVLGGISTEPAAAPATRTEAVGVALCVLAIFSWRGLVPWSDFAKVPSFMLLTLPVTWLALRFSHRTMAIASAVLVSAVALVAVHGFGSFRAIQTFGEWRDPIVTSQLYFLTTSAQRCS